MSARSVVVILLALICGIAAAVGVTMRQPSNEGVVETSPILVIKQNVPRGRMVTAEMLELKDWPKDFLPANVLTDPEQAIGRAIISPFLAGERLTYADIAAGVAMYRWTTMDIERQTHPNVELWHQRLKARPGFRDMVEVDYSELVGRLSF